MYRTPTVHGSTCLLLLVLTACNGPRVVVDLPEDADTLRGPPGSTLRFDAAMLTEPDAGGVPTFDASIRRDSGRTDSGTSEPLTCGGSPTPCSLVSSFSCTDQDGCRRDDGCGGVSRSCYSIFDSFSCTTQDGCYWSSSSRDCSGLARGCTGYSTRFSCTDQDGCTWREDCAGVATPCSLFNEFTCARQRGCYLR